MNDTMPTPPVWDSSSFDQRAANLQEATLRLRSCGLLDEGQAKNIFDRIEIWQKYQATRRYRVDITRICSQTKTVTVEANSCKDAVNKALEKAGDYDYAGLEKEEKYIARVLNGDSNDG